MQRTLNLKSALVMGFAVAAMLGLVAGGAQAAPIAYVDVCLTDGGGHAVNVDHLGQVVQVDLVLYIKNLKPGNTPIANRDYFITTYGNIISAGALKGSLMFDPDDSRGKGAHGWWINENYMDPLTGDPYAYNRVNTDPAYLNIGSSMDVDGDGDLDIGHPTEPDLGLQITNNVGAGGVYTPTDGNVPLGSPPEQYAKFTLARGIEFTVDPQTLSLGESTVIKFGPAAKGTSAQVKSDGGFADLYGSSVPTDLGIGNGMDSGVTLTSIVPEPATLALLGLGTIAVLVRRRRGF